MRSIFRVKKKNNMGIFLFIIGILLAVFSIGFLIYAILNKDYRRKFTEVELPEKLPLKKSVKKPVKKPVKKSVQEPAVTPSAPKPPMAPQQEEVKELEKAEVVGSTQSNKYHQSTCRHAQNIAEENILNFESREDAENQGYEPCGVCH